MGRLSDKDEKIKGATYIRLLPEHAGLMHKLEKECFSLPWSEEQCRAALAQSSFAAYGLVENSILLAYVSFYHTDREMEIVNLAVSPHYRRRGAGRQILSILLQACAKMGIEKVSLEVRFTNIPARSLYAGVGFVQTGLRKKYYPDTGEDALILTRLIAQG